MGRRGGIFKRVRSEAFAPWPQVELEGPGAAVLLVQVPESLGNRIGLEQAVLAALFPQLRIARQQPITANAPIDHDVSHVDVLRPILTRNALFEIAQRPLRGCERCKPRLAAPAGGGAGEQQRAATVLK